MSIGRNTRTEWKISRLYKLARRTLVASVVCLSVSFVNVLSVVLTHGHQRGLVCLTMCTVDVTVNVITIHWVSLTLLFYNRSVLILKHIRLLQVVHLVLETTEQRRIMMSILLPIWHLTVTGMKSQLHLMDKTWFNLICMMMIVSFLQSYLKQAKSPSQLITINSKALSHYVS